MKNKRIIVFSDIHGNAEAYESAIRIAKKIGFDELINLGDLLTYGCDSEKVLEITRNSVELDNMKLIKGNHDQLYFDIVCSNFNYYETLPLWIKESIDWTIENTDLDNYEIEYDWLDNYLHDDMFFAHANPFKYGDWTYLNSSDNLIKSAKSLITKNCFLGIFGHTHRQNISIISKSNEIVDIDYEKIFSKDYLYKHLALILNLDSLGQPRSKLKNSSFLLINISNSKFDFEFVDIPYDMDKHIKSIKSASFSKATEKKIISFF